MRTQYSILAGLVVLGAVAWGCNSDDTMTASAAGAANPGAGNGSSSTGSSGSASGGTNASSSSGTTTTSGASSSTSTSTSGDSGSPAGDGGTTGPAPVVNPYTDFAINHILMTGQSNSVANSGTPVLTKEQPYGNLMFSTGVMPGRGSKDYPNGVPCDGEGCLKYDPPTGFAPLVEGDLFFDYAVETAASGLANQISFLAEGQYKGKIAGLPDKHDTLVSIHGRSGNTYWCLRKGGCSYKPGYNHPFDQAMQEVESGKALAAAAGKSYVVRAVVNIHGESDHYSYTAGLQEFPISGSDGTPDKIKTYADGVVEWQQDYETSVKAITKQTQPLPMLINQISGWNDAKTSKVAQYQLDAHVAAPGKVVLVGPSYALDFAGDCRHFTNQGEQRLGEMFAKVYAKVVLEGKTWEPVRPKTVTRNGAELLVQFHVPVPPLAIDTDKVAAMKDFGFEYLDGAGAVQAISKVEVTGPDTVKITLGAAPAGAGHLTYAQNQTPLTCIGTPLGARGNLRDSDTTPSRLGFPLHNWSVHFDVAVP